MTGIGEENPRAHIAKHCNDSQHQQYDHRSQDLIGVVAHLVLLLPGTGLLRSSLGRPGLPLCGLAGLCALALQFAAVMCPFTDIGLGKATAFYISIGSFSSCVLTGSRLIGCIFSASADRALSCRFRVGRSANVADYLTHRITSVPVYKCMPTIGVIIAHGF